MTRIPLLTMCLQQRHGARGAVASQGFCRNPVLQVLDPPMKESHFLLDSIPYRPKFSIHREERELRAGEERDLCA